MSGATFTPTVEWQDVPDGAALPGDRQVEMNQTAGRTRARLMPELERHLDQRARCRDAPEDQSERPRLQVGGRPER